MNGLSKFFLMCSGSNLAILKRTPTEINKHIGIGAAIFFTGLFAALAGSYAMYTVFDSYFLALVIGLIWGLMIFNLDRYIVSTFKMRRTFFGNLYGALPRIVLAVIIAIVISKPLELRIFDSEIKAELALMQQENIKEQETLLASRFDGDILKEQEDIKALKAELMAQELKRDLLDAAALAEADGTGGSLKRNMGPIYKAKKADAEKGERELAALKENLLPVLAERQIQLAALKDHKQTELSALNEVALTGLASRVEALDRLSRKSRAILMASLFIMLLFIAIETTPIFVKLISSRSPYDYVLDKHEHAFLKQHELVTTLLSNEVANKLSFDTETGRFKTELAIAGEKAAIKEALESSYQDLKSGSKRWTDIFGNSSLFERI